MILENRSPKRHVGISSLMIFFLFLSSCSGEDTFDPKDVRDAETQGQLIVKQIEEHYARSGVLALSVEDVEDLLGEAGLPSPPVGSGVWQYRVLQHPDGEYFELSVCADDGYPCLFYSSRSQEWFMDR